MYAQTGCNANNGFRIRRRLAAYLHTSELIMSTAPV